MGREEHAQHAVLALVKDRRRAAQHGLLAVLGHQPDAADLFGHQHAAVGQEGQAPGKIEGRHWRHGERRIHVGNARAGIDLGVSRGRNQSQK